MSWSPQQDQALMAVSNWLANSDKQVFRLFGYAGTGKTTLATEIASRESGKVLFAAFTGKAALVMQSKGCTNASTIHRLIYKIEDAERRQPTFRLNPDSPLRRAALCVIDECSMVGAELAKDLLSFDVKILVLGDPAQLPPVKDAGYFTEHKPDIMLTEVHRQARDNPIIRLSMDIRTGKSFELGDHGACKIIQRKSLDSKQVLDADQVLVGLNKTRVSYNERVRELKGIKGLTPVVDEKLVCLRNNREKNLFNGSIWRVVQIKRPSPTAVRMLVRPEDSTQNYDLTEVSVHPFFFQGREQELDYSQRRESDEFTYGYALTVHKSQGSQWPNVMLFDESAAFREDRARWLYTGATRAAEKLTVVMS